ncbi:hypothetical protein AC578_10522 [Pseudocercospora eumusae]|uniref:Ubiquitin-like protease family profile domain-containing protein n=1 Tax=Pseudocercospora eumusae TaxID=321146 RepID=A0A139GV81_9PEZI|nr:hypothetical protein AC578_10522 [Pseudocercospora eumusae]
MPCFYEIYWRKRERIQWRACLAYLTSQNTTTTATNAARSPSVEEVTSARGSPERKRVRLSDSERHLFGRDYTVHANGAIPFQPVAATREENAADIEARRRASNMGAPYKPRGVQPSNTLRNGTKQAPQKGAIRGEYGPQATTQILPTSTSRGGNVKRKGFPDDGEDQMMQPSAKRHHHANGATSNPIDLTDGEDYSAGKVVRVTSQKPVKAPSGSQGLRHAAQPRQQKLSSQTDTFGNDQMQKADSYFAVPRGKNAWRPPRDDFDCAQIGSRAADDLRRKQPGSRELPEEIQDGSPPSANGHTKARPMKQTRPTQSKALQPIDLDRGVFDVRQYQETLRENGQGGTRDMDDVTSVFQTKNHRAPRSPTKGSTARRTIPQQLSAEDFQTHANGTAARLADQFQRDTEYHVNVTKAPTKTKAAERMQIQSRSGSSGEGSMDELQGERTVPPRSSRSISPQKQKPFKQPAMTNGTSLKRKAAAAATQPANIHAKPIKQKRGYQAPPSDVGKDGDDDDGGRIPVSAIYCRAYAGEEKQLELVWDVDHKAYGVERSKEPVRVPNTNRPVRIACGDFTQCLSGERGYLGIQLKGSSSEVTTGSMIIVFEDEAGLDAFRHDFVWSSPRLKPTLCSIELMEGIVEKQAKEQMVAFEKAKTRPPPMAPGPVLPRRKQAPQIHAQSPDEQEEEIVFEQFSEDDSMAAALLKDNHQNPRPRSSAAHQTVSPYFKPNNLRRSGREPKPVVRARSPTPVQVEKWTENNDLSFWQHEMTWPFTGKKRVSLFPNDLQKLDDEEMLNDNIVNFGLRYTEEFIRPELKDKVYWFNTYLYETLTKGTGKGINYAGVERWTKNVDLFTKPYIVVPINLNMHWFVAIICNLPNLQRKFADSDPVDPAVPSSRPAAHDENDTTRLQPPDREMTDLALSDAGLDSKPVSDDEKDAADGIFKLGDDGKVVNADFEDEQQATGAGKGRGRKKKKAPPGPRKIDPSTPVILTCDSFGFGRSKEIKVLKDYLVMEAKTKRKMELSASEIPQMTAKGIPGQKNFSDCGVYLLGYIEKFAQNPDEFVRKLLQFEMREEDFEFDPFHKRAAIRDQLLEFSRQNEANIYKAKEAKRDAKRRANGASAQQKCVAEGSPPARQKTPTPAPTPINEAARSRQQTPARAAQRAGMEASSRDQTRHDATEAAIKAYPTSQTLGDEDEELPVSPPRVTGGRNEEQPNATDVYAFADEQASSDGSEEMLDGGDTIHVSNEQQTSLAPQPTSAAYRESKSPLALQDGEPEDKALSPEDMASTQQQHADNSPDVIDIGDEDDDRRADSPEIPDSQPTQGIAVPVTTAWGKEYYTLD